MDDPSDDELVERCRAGSDDAFAILVGRYRSMVYGLIARTMGDPQRADDLAQDVFLRVYRGLPYFKGKARLSTWIYRIAVNVCLESRAARRPPTVPVDSPASDEHPRRELVARETADGSLELRDRLDKALARLPVHQRVLLSAHYQKEMRYEELAEVFDLPLGTVKTHLHRAKKHLRKLLEGELA